METNFLCPVCDYHYNLKERVPLKLECKHNICRECADKLYKSVEEIKCYFLCKSQPGEITDELIDKVLLRELKRTALYCNCGKDEVAFTIDMVKLCPVCHTCEESVKIENRSDVRSDFLMGAYNTLKFSIMNEGEINQKLSSEAALEFFNHAR